MTVDILTKEMPIVRISRALDIPRSTIYYTRTGDQEQGNPGYLKTLNLK